MKRAFLIILAIITSSVLYPVTTKGQVDRVLNLPAYDHAKYHFGFILAGNQMLFTIKNKPGFNNIRYLNEDAPGLNYDSLYILSINTGPTPGFTIGIVSNLRLGKYFDLRFVPSLAFGERKINYSFWAYRDSVPAIVDITKPVTSTYVELPLTLKYKSKRMNNVRGYLLGGIKYNIDLASNKKNKEEDALGKPTYVKLNSHDLLVEIGVGFDFYTTYFKFGTEIKMGYGINDLLVRDNNIFTSGIERLNSKIFILSFTFE